MDFNYTPVCIWFYYTQKKTVFCPLICTLMHFILALIGKTQGTPSPSLNVVIFIHTTKKFQANPWHSLSTLKIYFKIPIKQNVTKDVHSLGKAVVCCRTCSSCVHFQHHIPVLVKGVLIRIACTI